MSPERKAYESLLNQQLARLVAEVMRINAKVGHAGVDRMVRFDRVAESLQHIHDDLAQHLHVPKGTSDASWETLLRDEPPSLPRVSAIFGPKPPFPERSQG